MCVGGAEEEDWSPTHRVRPARGRVAVFPTPAVCGRSPVDGGRSRSASATDGGTLPSCSRTRRPAAAGGGRPPNSPLFPLRPGRQHQTPVRPASWRDARPYGSSTLLSDSQATVSVGHRKYHDILHSDADGPEILNAPDCSRL